MPGKAGLHVYCFAVVIGLAFGAGDQYLGTIHVSQHFAASSTVSGLSAPWLLLPFVAGATQGSARRSGLIGLCISLSAVAGYTAMILSPMEGVHLTPASIATPISQLIWFLAALVSGSVYGVLGYRWRALRSHLSALLAVGALLLEPIAGLLRLGRWSSGNPVAYQIELASAAGAVCYFAFMVVRYSQHAEAAR